MQAPAVTPAATTTPPAPAVPDIGNIPLLSWHAAAMAKIAQEESARLEEERKSLAQERAAFEAAKAKIASVHFPDRIKLSIGGQVPPFGSVFRYSELESCCPSQPRPDLCHLARDSPAGEGHVSVEHVLGLGLQGGAR